MLFASGQIQFCRMEECRNRGSGSACAQTSLLKSQAAAEMAVLSLRRDPAAIAMLRNMASRDGFGSGVSLTNDAVLKWVASQLASGRLRMCQTAFATTAASAGDPATGSGANSAPPQTERAFPLADRSSKTQQSAAAPATDQSSFPTDVELVALAKALTDATQAGVPFCEECAKAAMRA